MIQFAFLPAQGSSARCGLTAVFVCLFAFCGSHLNAQEHLYRFHYHPVNPDTSIRYLYDWYEIEPDGWMRREMGMFKEEMHDLYGTMEPERHPDGTAINLRVFSLEGELLDDRRYVCRDTTIIGFGPIHSDFRVEIEHETNPDASIFDTGTMFVAEDDTAFVEFFNLTDGKVSFEHSWFYWDAEEEAFFVDEGVSGRTSDAVIRIPVAPDFRRMQYHAFEFVTADRDTVFFNAHVTGDVILGSHLLFEERDRGDIVLGRVKAGNTPR